MSRGRRRNRWTVLWLVLVSWGLSPDVAAHPISITTLNSNYDGHNLDVRVFALVEDLMLFGAARPGPFGRFDRETLEQAAAEHAQFYGRHLHWYADGHRKLTGELLDVDFSDIPEEGVDIDDIKRHSFVFHFRFRDVGQPETLTLYQDLGGDEPPVLSDLHWGAFQHGVPLERISIMHRQAHTVELDGEADWEQLQADPAAAEARWQERENDPLQVPGTSAVFAFVYFDEQGVRVELLVPLLILDRWMDLPLDDEGRLTVEEQQRIRAEVGEVLAATHTMEIDGQSVVPRVQRLQFLGPRAEDLAMDAPEQDVFRMNGRVSLILRYPVREVPQEFRMAWTNYEGVPNIPTSVYAYERPRLGTSFGPQTEVFTWKEPEPRHRPAARPRPHPPQRPAGALPLISSGLLVLAWVMAALAFRRRLPRAVAGVLIALCLAGGWLTRSWATVSLPLPGSAAAPVDEAEVEEIFASLQDNLYRAFRFADEGQVYDALSAEVTPGLVEPLYFQVLDSLRMEDQGGAIARVDAVERVTLETVRQESSPAPLVEVEAEWLVRGTVEHWGHIHGRTHRHRARFELLGQDGAWKIHRFEPQHVERVDRSVEVRR